MVDSSTPAAPRGRTDENIYLFIPNLIGTLIATCVTVHPLTLPVQATRG